VTLAGERLLHHAIERGPQAVRAADRSEVEPERARPAGGRGARKVKTGIPCTEGKEMGQVSDEEFDNVQVVVVVPP
jgi:hypothetical protein